MFDYENPATYEAVITTDRTELLPMLATHAGLMFPILSDPELYLFTGDLPPRSEEILYRRYKWLEDRKSPDGTELWLNWMIKSLTDSEAIGYMQATVMPDCTYVAWVIGLKWQSKGYATEATKAVIDWLSTNGCTNIRSCIHPHHIASQRVAEKIGMKKSDEMIDNENIWILKQS